VKPLALVVTGACLLALGACWTGDRATEAADQRAADEAAIRALAAAWHEAWAANDADAVVALYADDGIVLPQDLPPIEGRERLLGVYRGVFDAVSVVGSGEIQEIEVAGDWAFYRTHYRLVATPHAGGDPIEDAGSSLFILRRQHDGQWRIARLMANSDRPRSTAD
jgi:uncharacterized protein (TIGR02246 family)